MIKLIDILNEYKINNPIKYPGATLIIYDDGETLLDADSGEYESDIDDDNIDEDDWSYVPMTFITVVNTGLKYISNIHDEG